MTDTIDDKANEYAKSVKLEEGNYVRVSYTCGYLQAESDLICKLWKTEQFTVSKIAEMLDKRVWEVRNALNHKDWK